MDKGLEAEQDGVQMMKPIPGLDALLARAVKLGVYGTKMRSVITGASKPAIAAIAAQQFEVARQIAAHGLVPIIEPEVSIKSPVKAEAEAILNEELTKHLGATQDRVMLKLTIPDQPDLYHALTQHPKVERVVALSGGYKLDDACTRLKPEPRHDRELQPSPHRRPPPRHDGRGVQHHPEDGDRQDLRRLHQQGLTRPGFPAPSPLRERAGVRVLKRILDAIVTASQRRGDPGTTRPGQAPSPPGRGPG